MRLVIYTHKSYEDCLRVFEKQWDKFGNPDFNVTVCSNEGGDIDYHESLSYSERLLSCLQRLEDEEILYVHEDMPLVSRIGNLPALNDYDFIRLAWTGTLFTKGDKPVLEILPHSPDYFAVQPTIWRRESLIKFLIAAGPQSIWDLEIKGKDINPGLKGGVYFEGNEKRRGGHFDSNIFPSVLTALCKGKWNLSEYPKLLFTLAENSININERGFV